MNPTIYLERQSASFIRFAKTNAVHLLLFLFVLPFAAGTTGFSFSYFQGSKIAILAQEYKDFAISPILIGYIVAFLFGFFGSLALHLLSLLRIINNHQTGKFANKGEQNARFMLIMSFVLNLSAGIAGDGLSIQSFLSFLAISAFFEIILYIDSHAMLELELDEAMTYVSKEITTQHKTISNQKQLEIGEHTGQPQSDSNSPTQNDTDFSDLIA